MNTGPPTDDVIDESLDFDSFKLSSPTIVLQNLTGDPPNYGSLSTLLDRCIENGLREVIISASSQIQRLDFIPMQLESLGIHNGRIHSLREVATIAKLAHLDISCLEKPLLHYESLQGVQLRSLSIPCGNGGLVEVLPTLHNLKQLVLIDWPWANLEELRSASVEELSFHRGKLKCTSGGEMNKLNRVVFLKNSKLSSVLDLNAKEVIAIQCPNIDLCSFNCYNCQNLSSLGKNSISSINFLDDCPRIRSIHFGPSKHKYLDSIGGVFPETLKCAILEGIPVNAVRQLGIKNRSLLIGNNLVAMDQGQEVTITEFLDRCATIRRLD